MKQWFILYFKVGSHIPYFVYGDFNRKTRCYEGRYFIHNLKDCPHAQGTHAIISDANIASSILALDNEVPLVFREAVADTE